MLKTASKQTLFSLALPRRTEGISHCATAEGRAFVINKFTHTMTGACRSYQRREGEAREGMLWGMLVDIGRALVDILTLYRIINIWQLMYPTYQENL